MKVSHIQSLNLKRYHCLHNMRLEISSLKIFSFQTGNDLDYLQFTVIRSEGKPRKITGPEVSGWSRGQDGKTVWAYEVSYFVDPYPSLY